LEYVQQQRAFQLVEKAEGWQLATDPAYAPWARELHPEPKPSRLTAPALETLAIIAYRQPITRAEVEQIRGVSVDGVMQTIMERGLVEAVGRAEVVGRPPTYGTTVLFLEYFGLAKLEDLPAADELRRLVIQKPAAPVTADAGLATTPPEQLKEGSNAPKEEVSPSAPATGEAASAPQ
jgi:segregation and condensation protein B